jgi:hypothetical protein
VVLNRDVLFHPALLRDLLSARHENALLLAYREANQPELGEEEMKVKVRGGRVVEMSKTMDPAEADGENLGIVKFGPAGGPEPRFIQRAGDFIERAGDFSHRTGRGTRRSAGCSGQRSAPAPAVSGPMAGRAAARTPISTGGDSTRHGLNRPGDASGNSG